MSTKQNQTLKTLTPQPTVGAVPIRLMTTHLGVRSIIIEMAKSSVGCVYISDTEANASTDNRHILYNPGDVITITAADYADLDGLIRLNELWLWGDTIGDKIVVSYMDPNAETC